MSSDPENLKGVDPGRLERFQRAYGRQMKRYRELGMGSFFPWSIGALASPSWAKLVFPNLSETEAVAALWEKIFMAVRVTGDGTAVEKWRQHQQNLQRHVEILNGYAFDRLHYYNALGSDFTVGLCRDHIWCAGGESTPRGQFFMPNMPTEEVFTAPDRNRCEGVVYAALPLSKDGNVIENIRFVVKEGRIVEATATANEELLQKSISVDEGASRFGEVALVPYDSPISNAKTLFFETLFDENAACHLAFGEAYPTTVKGAMEGADSARPQRLHHPRGLHGGHGGPQHRRLHRRRPLRPRVPERQLRLLIQPHFLEGLVPPFFASKYERIIGGRGPLCAVHYGYRREL